MRGYLEFEIDGHSYMQDFIGNTQEGIRAHIETWLKGEIDLLGYFDISIEIQHTDFDMFTVLAVNASWELVGRGVIKIKNTLLI